VLLTVVTKYLLNTSVSIQSGQVTSHSHRPRLNKEHRASNGCLFIRIVLHAGAQLTISIGKNLHHSNVMDCYKIALNSFKFLNCNAARKTRVPAYLPSSFLETSFFDILSWLLVLFRYGYSISGSTLNLLWGITVAIFAAGGMIGSLCAGAATKKLGLKRILLYNNVFAAVAAIFLGCSQAASSFEMLIIGEFAVFVSVWLCDVMWFAQLKNCFIVSSTPRKFEKRL